jgi:GTP cyclohydrolase I
LITYYSRGPQLQETLGIQVVNHFCRELEPRGVFMVMRAVHGCMATRGVCTGMNAGMTTSITRGVFREDAKARAEVMDLIKLSITDRR